MSQVVEAEQRERVSALMVLSTEPPGLDLALIGREFPQHFATCQNVFPAILTNDQQDCH